MTKPIIAIAAAVAVLTMAGHSMADFQDDFEGAGYTAGNDVPAPWVTTGDNNGVQNVSPDGTGFPGGANDNGVHNTRVDKWEEMKSPTGYPDDTAFIYSVKFRRDSNDNNSFFNGRVGADVGNGGSTYFYWEHDNDPFNQVNWYFEQGGHGMTGNIEGLFAINADTWYELIMTASPAGGGDGEDWNVSLQHQEWNGTSFNAPVTDLATSLWDQPTVALPFNATEVRLDSYGAISGTQFDDVSVQNIPEPSSCGLLALGLVGLLGWRRRRQK